MDEQGRFFSDISEIRTATSELNENVNRIQNLHQRQLDTVANDPQHDQINGQLQELTNETRQLSNSLKSAIKRLESQTAKLDPRDPNHNVRRSQTGLVKSKWGLCLLRARSV
jgi:syntaxin 1B/2/3